MPKPFLAHMRFRPFKERSRLSEQACNTNSFQSHLKFHMPKPFLAHMRFRPFKERSRLSELPVMRNHV